MKNVLSFAIGLMAAAMMESHSLSARGGPLQANG